MNDWTLKNIVKTNSDKQVAIWLGFMRVIDNIGLARVRVSAESNVKVLSERYEEFEVCVNDEWHVLI